MSIIRNGKTYGVETKIVGGSTDTSLKDFLNDEIYGTFTIPEGITKLTEYAIAHKDNITKVVVPDSVTELGDYFVYHCTNADDITIGDGVTSVPDYCISSYAKGSISNKVKNVTLGSGIQTIGIYALNCGKKLTVKATIPPVLQSSSLYYADNLCYIFVPYESLDAYKEASYWSARSVFIRPIHNENIETVELFTDTFTESGVIETANETARFRMTYTINGEEFEHYEGVPFSYYMGENYTGSTRYFTTSVEFRGVEYTINIEQTSVVAIDYTVEGVEGSDYSFTQNEDGWWVNTNQNVDSSFCYAKVTVNSALPFIVMVNQNVGTEKGFDYAVISDIDSDLPIDATQTGGLYTTKGVDGDNTYTGWTSTGSSYITIKYCKDDTQSKGTDTFKFKIV